MHETFLSSKLLTQSKEIVHAFGTRHSPVYPDGFSPAILNQIHGNEVLIVTKQGNQGDGDGMITRIPHIALTIKTADCVPVLFYDEKKKIAGAIHAGWRGLYNEVVVQALKKASDIFASELSSVKVAIGPCIEESCYEVGIDIVNRFKAKFDWWEEVIHIKNSKSYLNLRAGVTLQLITTGLKPENIEQIDLCTFCRKDLFYSWRRDCKTKERMFSFIGLKNL